MSQQPDNTVITVREDENSGPIGFVAPERTEPAENNSPFPAGFKLPFTDEQMGKLKKQSTCSKVVMAIVCILCFPFSCCILCTLCLCTPCMAACGVKASRNKAKKKAQTEAAAAADPETGEAGDSARGGGDVAGR